MKRYGTLREMMESRSARGTAFEYTEDGVRRTVSYSGFLEAIDRYPLPQARTVGILFGNDMESITAFFALAGKRRLVLMNPEDDERILRKQIAKTGVSFLAGPEDLCRDLKDALVPDAPAPDSDILLFTSGTTEEARAVVLTEQNLCSAAYNGSCMLALKDADRHLSVLPFSHVFGLVCALLWPLNFGATVCLGNGIRSIFTDFALYRPTVACLVPQMAAFLSANRLFNAELKLVLIGAGVCDDATLSRIADMGIRVSYGYGLTETSSGIALSVGKDPRAMSICPDYEVKITPDGEIAVKSATTIMKGYLNDAKATAEVLHDGFLFTGDLGRIENGLLYITGRKKEVLVFSDGSKVFIPEYENRLAAALKGETDFAIIQGRRGEIVLVIREKGSGTAQKVDAFNASLPRSHRIADIVYTDKSLPRTRTGKVRRYELKEYLR